VLWAGIAAVLALDENADTSGPEHEDFRIFVFG
jgi:hypothetical protein